MIQRLNVFAVCMDAYVSTSVNTPDTDTETHICTENLQGQGRISS